MHVRKSDLRNILAFGLIVFATPIIAYAQNISEDQLAIAEINFATADEDSDGGLTPDEFTTFIDANAAAKLGRTPMIKQRGMYGRAFARMDADKNNVVTWDEFKTAAASRAG